MQAAIVNVIEPIFDTIPHDQLMERVKEKIADDWEVCRANSAADRSSG